MKIVAGLEFVNQKAEECRRQPPTTLGFAGWPPAIKLTVRNTRAMDAIPAAQASMLSSRFTAFVIPMKPENS